LEFGAFGGCGTRDGRRRTERQGCDNFPSRPRAYVVFSDLIKITAADSGDEGIAALPVVPLGAEGAPSGGAALVDDVYVARFYVCQFPVVSARV